MNNQALVQNAYRLHTAIPAFNIPYLPMIRPVAEAAVAADSLVFIAVARLEWFKFEARSMRAIYEEYQRWCAPEHTRLHLDHLPVIDEDLQTVPYFEEIREAVELGYDSVMVDGSRLTLEENIAATRRVADLAHAAGIPIEAELGAVMGHEEGPVPPYEELFRSGKGFTGVDEARRFVAGSQCDWLSVAIGNIHGAVSKAKKDAQKVSARLDLDHLEKLRAATGIPLVLHGGSGIPKDYILGAIQRGVAKINVATDIRQPYEATMRDTGNVKTAQQAVYESTLRVLAEQLEVAGNRPALAQAETKA